MQWPNAKVSATGSGQLSQVMQTVSKDPTQHAKLKDEIESQSTAYYASACLWGDGIIELTDTRDVVGFGPRVGDEGEGPCEGRFRCV